MSAPAPGTVDVAAFSQRGEKRDGPHQKPTEPHAFALPAFTDPVHAVVPVAGADERQAVFAGEFKARVKASGAVFEQRGRFVRDHGLEEGIMLAGTQDRTFEKRQDLVQNRGAPRNNEERGGSECEPDDNARAAGRGKGDKYR